MDATLCFTRGVYFSFCPPSRGEGAKIWIIGWLGGKIWWFIKKKRKYKGEEVEKRGNRENFHCPWGKNIISEKGGGEYPILGKYTPLYFTFLVLSKKFCLPTQGFYYFNVRYWSFFSHYWSTDSTGSGSSLVVRSLIYVQAPISLPHNIFFVWFTH